MNNYQDKWTRWHNKPCTNQEPSSNNGWVYTAYSKYLAPRTTDPYKRAECYNECLVSMIPLKVNRLPDKVSPPFSKDEVIGCVSLGLMNHAELKRSHWNFCNFLEYTPEPLSIPAVFRAIKQSLSLKKEYKQYLKDNPESGIPFRNFFWETQKVDLYPLAFWLASHDQYYVNKFNKQKATLLQTILFYINFIFTLTKGNKSVRMLLWLQLKDMKHWLLKLVPEKKWAETYFGKEHPFVTGEYK